MMLEKKRIFITGGAGFIGAALIGKLVEHNEITAFDNLDRNSIESRQFANHPNLNLVVGDILDVEKIESTLPKDTDIIIHCAGIAGIKPVLKEPLKTMQVNIIGSMNILEAASRLRHCSRVICFSTSEVYGQHAVSVDEDQKTAIGRAGEARWTYAVSKLAEEHLAMAFHQERRLATSVLRPFNIYGPGQVGESAMRNFIIRALQNEPIEIHGDGSQIRAWCYVDDMVDATLRAITQPAAVGETFNIGNPRGAISVLELANIIRRVLGSRSKLVHSKKTYTDVEARIPNADKARKLLGFEARVDLEEGIRRTAEYYGASDD